MRRKREGGREEGELVKANAEITEQCPQGAQDKALSRQIAFLCTALQLQCFRGSLT